MPDMPPGYSTVEASFRDPAGFLFMRDGELRRQVHESYAEDYNALVSSGLLNELVNAGKLVDHEELPASAGADDRAWKVLRPRRVRPVSYPFEWSFSQLRDAAQLTLDIARCALHHDLVLKDATAYNVTFDGSRPIWLDTLSFERYREGTPWHAYAQFCGHFLAPLALCAYVDGRLLDLLQVHMEGIPLDLTSGLLPARTWLLPSLFLHVHAHSRTQARYLSRIESSSARSGFSRSSFEGLLESLTAAVQRLDWRASTTWSGYEQDNSYSVEERSRKMEVVEQWLKEVVPGTVLDLGANTGRFSSLAASLGHKVVALDGDVGASDLHYRNSVGPTGRSVTTLRVDLRNLSAGLGWAGRERSGLLERLDADVVLALALIHHLCLSGHLDLDRVASFLAGLAPTVIVEWVPLSDPQALRLVGNRKPQFERVYEERQFLHAFRRVFNVIESTDVSGTGRRMYRMERKPVCVG